MRSKKVKDIIDKVAKEEQVSPIILQKILQSSFRFVARTIKMAEKGKHETFKSILIPGFGKFYPTTASYMERNTKNRLAKEKTNKTKYKYLTDSTKTNNDDNR